MHLLFNNSYHPPFPINCDQVVLGMGCFWGAEKLFWSTSGVWTTAVGYSGGSSNEANYEKVCSGTTNHAEVVRVIYDKSKIELESLLKIFWESHDPTQINRQGNDIGKQYRSIVFVSDKNQLNKALALRNEVQKYFDKNNIGKIQTEISVCENFFYAEEYHQQYLIKNPNGYCGLKGLGVKL